MEKFYYTNERNVQIIISLLKANNIKNIIASPGTTNMTFVVSVQNDPFFNVYSSVDERSAAYLACGMAAEMGEPVVLSCTGATASRNYMSGLTEAYYRKLPILAITSHRGHYQIGHLYDQQIDRRTLPNDIAVEHVTLPIVKDSSDENYCIIEANKAILALKHHGGGPVHINLYTDYSKDFSVREINNVRVINRYTFFDKLPILPNGRIGIFIGSHRHFSDAETNIIDEFCFANNAVVFSDRTSGYRGKFEIDYSIISCQQCNLSELLKLDLLIHIGEVSGAYKLNSNPSIIWRVSEDGALRDTFGRLTAVFEMPEMEFFKFYTPQQSNKDNSLYLSIKKEIDNIINCIPDLPFSNIWIAQYTINKLPDGANFHMGIYNSLRSWDFFSMNKSITSNCNVGGFGIDGGLSALIGASFVNPNKIYIGVFGDLAFFYDMNVLGNRHVGKNVRILLINNGKGTEFRNYNHPCYFLGEIAEPYVAASGHYGNKSSTLVKHYSEDLGYIYMSANNKDEFCENINVFLDPLIGDKPIIFEVFTDTQDESDALEKMLNIIKPKLKQELVSNVAKVIKTTCGQKGYELLKKIVKK